MKGTKNSDVSLITKSGVTFTIPKTTNKAQLVSLLDNETAAHKQRIFLYEHDISVEVNGQNFAFSLWNDGSLKAKGSTGWNARKDSNNGGTEHWKQKCTKDVKPGDKDYTYCTGSIFENNMKLVREKSKDKLHF
jgi:hypothetical protein